MRNISKPPFLVGLLSVIIFIISFAMLGSNHAMGLAILYAAFALALVTWIWTIIEVSNTGPNELKKYQKSFWLIIVVAIPLLGSLIYHIAHQRRRKIAA